MKKRVTEKAIEACVTAYGQTLADEFRAETHGTKEYFFGKRLGIIEAFAALTDQSWLNAEMMLRKRHAAPLLEKV